MNFIKHVKGWNGLKREKNWNYGWLGCDEMYVV